MCHDDALYKFTFYLLTYLLTYARRYRYRFDSQIVTKTNNTNSLEPQTEQAINVTDVKTSTLTIDYLAYKF